MILVKKFRRRWTQRGNELGQVDVIRETPIFLLSTEQRPTFEEVPCLVFFS